MIETSWLFQKAVDLFFVRSDEKRAFSSISVIFIITFIIAIFFKYEEFVSFKTISPYEYIVLFFLFALASGILFFCRKERRVILVAERDAQNDTFSFLSPLSYRSRIESVNKFFDQIAPGGVVKPGVKIVTGPSGSGKSYLLEHCLKLHEAVSAGIFKPEYMVTGFSRISTIREITHRLTKLNVTDQPLSSVLKKADDATYIIILDNFENIEGEEERKELLQELHDLSQNGSFCCVVVCSSNHFFELTRLFLNKGWAIRENTFVLSEQSDGDQESVARELAEVGRAFHKKGMMEDPDQWAHNAVKLLGGKAALPLEIRLFRAALELRLKTTKFKVVLSDDPNTIIKQAIRFVIDNYHPVPELVRVLAALSASESRSYLTPATISRITFVDRDDVDVALGYCLSVGLLEEEKDPISNSRVVRLIHGRVSEIVKDVLDSHHAPTQGNLVTIQINAKDNSLASHAEEDEIHKSDDDDVDWVRSVYLFTYVVLNFRLFMPAFTGNSLDIMHPGSILFPSAFSFIDLEYLNSYLLHVPWLLYPLFFYKRFFEKVGYCRKLAAWNAVFGPFMAIIACAWPSAGMLLLTFVGVSISLQFLCYARSIPTLTRIAIDRFNRYGFDTIRNMVIVAVCFAAHFAISVDHSATIDLSSVIRAPYPDGGLTILNGWLSTQSRVELPVSVLYFIGAVIGMLVYLHSIWHLHVGRSGTLQFLSLAKRRR